VVIPNWEHPISATTRGPSACITDFVTDSENP
jgi:hypothetical protein